jgi:hypothetical protein
MLGDTVGAQDNIAHQTKAYGPGIKPGPYSDSFGHLAGDGNPVLVVFTKHTNAPKGLRVAQRNSSLTPLLKLAYNGAKGTLHVGVFTHVPGEVDTTDAVLSVSSGLVLLADAVLVDEEAEATFRGLELPGGSSVKGVEDANQTTERHQRVTSQLVSDHFRRGTRGGKALLGVVHEGLMLANEGVHAWYPVDNGSSIRHRGDGKVRVKLSVLSDCVTKEFGLVSGEGLKACRKIRHIFYIWVDKSYAIFSKTPSAKYVR